MRTFAMRTEGSPHARPAQPSHHDIAKFLSLLGVANPATPIARSFPSRTVSSTRASVTISLAA